MLSVIICSVSKEKLAQTIANIEATIGVEHEVIAIDNLEHQYPITKAYNIGAEKASFPYLLFVHEDVRFHSSGWGSFIEEKLKEPNCGVIGFAGTKMMQDVYSGWLQDHDWMSLFLYQGTKEGETELRTYGVTLEHPFEEVVALDGLALFVRKNVWEEFKFDEEHLSGFHCYDVDFTLRIAASKRYENYVCTSFRVLVEHQSEGNLNDSWFTDTIRMHRTLWKPLLPIYVDGFSFNKKRVLKKKERTFHYFVRMLLRRNHPESQRVLKEFIFTQCSMRHISHCISDIWLYVKVALCKNESL